MVSEICRGAWKFFVIWLGAAVSFINDQVDGHFPLQTANIPVAEVIAQFVDLGGGSWWRVQLGLLLLLFCFIFFFKKGGNYHIAGLHLEKGNRVMSSQLSLINGYNSWSRGNNRVIVAADIILQTLPWATSYNGERRKRTGKNWAQTGPSRGGGMTDLMITSKCKDAGPWNSISICDSIS